MSEGFKETNAATGELKENSIEGVLKGLQGKTLTKKSIFYLLLGINISELPITNVPLQEMDTKANKKENKTNNKPVKGKKKKEKKNKQDELGKFFDSLVNTINIQTVKKQEPQTIIPEVKPLLSDIKLEVETEVEAIILPEIVDIPINILNQNKEHSDNDLDKESDEDSDKDDISVIIYPLGIKIPNNTKPKEPKEPKEPVEIKCKACKKTFTAESSLRRHYKRFQVCLDFMALPESAVNNKIDRGLHYILDELLSKSVSLNGEKECRWCKTTFTTIGNLHKHLNTSKVCNKMAIQEFKKLFLSLEV
jgi:hypothetical protein